MKNYLFIFVLFVSPSCFSQILNDATAKEWISDGLEKMYNYEFKEAQEHFLKIKEKYPQHPAYPMLVAIAMEMQYFPLKDNPTQGLQYQSLLSQATAAAQKILDKDENDIEGTFFMMIAQGYQAAFNADNHGVLDALGPAKRAYNHLKKGMKMVNQQPEFLYSCGLYNYYRIAYPETHTALKPFMWVFMGGDKKLGLVQMDLATRKAVFTKIEAIFYSGYVQMKYEGNPAKAIIYSDLLKGRFPNNLMFQMQRAEILSTLGRFDEADDLLPKLLRSKNNMYLLAGLTFNGLYLEKGKKNDAEAEANYLRATKLPFEERFSKDYQAISFLGLARIAKRRNDATKTQEYAKRAMKIAEYKTTIAEAKALLN
jgi:tetratricopeptide (TPR) repeat protein